MGRGCEGEARLIKNNMSEDHDVIGERVKAHRVERGANLCRAIADKLGVASIPRNPEMLVGR
jgi:hypothetical protein